MTQHVTPPSLSPEKASVRSKPEPEDFIQHLEGHDLTEDEKIALLGVLFEIMQGFVELGFGSTPVQHLIENYELTSLVGGAVLESQNNPNAELINASIKNDGRKDRP